MPRKRKKKEPVWKRTVKRINIFFRRMRRQEVLTFMAFLLISAFFWIIETASEENDATFNVVFFVENQPTNIVFTTQIPKELKVSIKDKNINLLDYSYHNTFDTLMVDFSRYNDALGNFRISGAELQSLLINELFPSTKITSLSPSLIDAKFAVTGGKMLPIVLDADISTADNYRIHKPVISPDSTLVHAPSQILDNLTMIKTEHYEVTNLKDTMSLLLPLKLEVGVKSTPAQVKVLIPVARYVEKTINNVTINVIDVPRGEQVAIFPNKTDVSFLVDFANYSDITADDFYLTVSYNSIKSADQKYLPVDFISYANSDFVSNVQIATDKVEYIIEKE